MSEIPVSEHFGFQVLSEVHSKAIKARRPEPILNRFSYFQENGEGDDDSDDSDDDDGFKITIDHDKIDEAKTTYQVKTECLMHRTAKTDNLQLAFSI